MKDNKGYEIYKTRELAEAARKEGEITAMRTGNNRPEGTGWAYFACIPEYEACQGDIKHFRKLQQEAAAAATRDQIMKAWRPAACEEYFTFEGKQYIYCYNSITRGHCYYCNSDDLYYKDYATRELL